MGEGEREREGDDILQRSPRPTSLSISYEEFCDGCSTCRPPIIEKKPQWRWYHLVIGMPKNINQSGKRKEMERRRVTD